MKSFLKVTFLLVVVLIFTGCAQVSGESDFTLAGGETVRGPLFLFSNNATLKKDSRVDGPVVMLCCNLIVDGAVTGDIYLVSGNIRLDANASVEGDVKVVSGNMNR